MVPLSPDQKCEAWDHPNEICNYNLKIEKNCFSFEFVSCWLKGSKVGLISKEEFLSGLVIKDSSFAIDFSLSSRGLKSKNPDMTVIKKVDYEKNCHLQPFRGYETYTNLYNKGQT